MVRTGREERVFVVADGHGSAPWARIAAQTAAERIAVELDQNLGDVLAAFSAAHRSARRATKGHDGVGTTAVAAHVDRSTPPRLTVAHVGAARAYLLRPKETGPMPDPAAPTFNPVVTLASGARFVCLTRDHTSVCDMVERGHLPRERGRTHPLRGRTVRALGTDLPHEPEVATLELAAGDSVLLCTDGLWDRVDHEAMAAVLDEQPNPKKAVHELVSKALAGGAHDDVTALVMRFAEAEPRPGAGQHDRAPQPRRASATPGMQPAEGPKKGSTANIVERLGRDITDLARGKKLDPVIGRDIEIRKLAQALVARRKANALLVGPAGVGKTCIVEGLAQLLVSDAMPAQLRGKRIVELSMSELVAGTKYRGEFEARMQEVIDVATSDDDLVLFIDELHTVMGAGDSSGGAGDAAQILKPALARGEMRMIGATTTKEFQRHIASDPAFERRFTVLPIEEPSVGHAIAIVQGLADRFTSHYEVAIDDAAFVAAVNLSKRYVQGRYLPDKAIDLLDQACSRKLVPLASVRPGENRVTADDIALLIAEKCDVDVELVGRDMDQARHRMGELSAFLAARVFGQATAMDTVASTLVRAYGGLKDPQRPVASFLFLGPTGVGKTESAKVLCEFLFGDPDRLLRIDMSEYMDRYTVSRLLGAPPGYIGHGDGGQLTSPMHLNGSRVVLFDEIEKAHPHVLMILLQLLDEGSLTDSFGKKASFREAVIVLTSNLIRDAATPRDKVVGFRREDAPEQPNDSVDEDDLCSRLALKLPPELVSRIGRVVCFNRLGEAAARQIVEHAIGSMVERVRAQGAEVVVPADLADRVLARMPNLEHGARGLVRLVQEAIGGLLDAPEQLHASVARAHSVGGDRHKLALLALTVVGGDASDALLEALAAIVRVSVRASDLRFMEVDDGVVIAVLSDVPAALLVARQLAVVPGAGVPVKRYIHRGSVRPDADDPSRPRGVAVQMLDLLREALRGTDHELVLTAAAANDLENVALSPLPAPESWLGGELWQPSEVHR